MVDAAHPRIRGDFAPIFGRVPPEHPVNFAARLAQKVFTNGKSDCELVAKLYAETLVNTIGYAEELSFHCGWGDEEAERLAAVLPFAANLTKLDLHANPRIGSRGCDALASALESGAVPHLKIIQFDSRWGRAADQLRRACLKRDPELEIGGDSSEAAKQFYQDYDAQHGSNFGWDVIPGDRQAMGQLLQRQESVSV